ncbi:MAG: hypothetical protein AB7O97_09500 [Planctomycetota bacterium]
MATPRTRSFLLPVLAAVLGGCGGSLDGRTFESEQALEAAAGDWVILGRFDLKWPATVVQIEEGRDRLRFRRGATPHEYSGYDGYDLRAVHLESDGKQGIVVLRSREKTAAPDAPAAPR